MELMDYHTQVRYMKAYKALKKYHGFASDVEKMFQNLFISCSI